MQSDEQFGPLLSFFLSQLTDKKNFVNIIGGVLRARTIRRHASR